MQKTAYKTGIYERNYDEEKNMYFSVVFVLTLITFVYMKRWDYVNHIVTSKTRTDRNFGAEKIIFL